MYSFYSYNKKDLAMMPQRSDESNKGDYGKLLCVCGSVGMCGAAYLSAKAAYRTGAGLVRILTVRENLVPLQTALPEAIISVYDADDPDPHTVTDAAEWADAIVIGCGLGRSIGSRRITSQILKGSDKPKVIDADALNMISANPVLKKYLKETVITPHPLEMSRLTGISSDDILKSADRVAYDFAKKYGAICLLKKHETVVSDGSDALYVNKSGNNGMATAGSGDVLSGIIGGILAQNKDRSLSMKDAAALGAYIHGLAGDAAADRLGKYSMMACDIIDHISCVLKEI